MKDKYLGFSRVATNGYSYCTSTFFNPFTLAVFEAVTYDNNDQRNENRDVDGIGFCDEAIRLFKHYKGIIAVGDLVKIVKGRKFKGEVKKVVKEFTYKIDGMYGRCYGDVEYLVFDDGTKVARDNCELVQNYEALFEEITGKTRQSYLEEYFNDKEVSEYVK